MMTKECFVELINWIKEYQDTYAKVEEILQFGAENKFFDMEIQLLSILVKEFEQEAECVPVIFDFCLNNSFGATPLELTLKDGKREKKYKINTADKLYEFLLKAYPDKKGFDK